MKTDAQISKGRLWTGRFLYGLTTLFLVMDGVMKLVKPAPFAEAFTRLGYPQSEAFGIGILLLVCTAFYIIPRTSVVGALLLTAYLGGATATHVRVGDPSWVFAVIFGAIVWTGLILKDVRLSTFVIELLKGQDADAALTAGRPTSLGASPAR